MTMADRGPTDQGPQQDLMRVTGPRRGPDEGEAVAHGHGAAEGEEEPCQQVVAQEQGVGQHASRLPGSVFAHSL